MARFQESDAKTVVRMLLHDASAALQRKGLTYLGLPAEDALDVKVLAPLLGSVIAIDEKQSVLDETERTLAQFSFKQDFIPADMWHFLRDQYPAYKQVADVTFLDFYGGGIRKRDPYAEEIAGLRAYFAKQAQHRARAFVLAWTYMPRDKGKESYLSALAPILDAEDLGRLKKTSGVWLRSAAIRLLIRQSLIEHRMSASIYQHVMYKRSMNTLIVLFSAGSDAACRLPMDAPDALLDEPVHVYENQELPKLVPMQW